MAFCIGCIPNGTDGEWETRRPTKSSAPKLVFIGLDNSGKTSIIHSLLNKTRRGRQQAHVPPAATNAVRRYTAKLSGNEIVAIDMPGCLNQREFWMSEIEQADAVVFVVDPLDELRFPVVRREFYALGDVLSQKWDAKLIPCLVLATKQDIRPSLSTKSTLNAIGVASALANLPAPWCFKACSALDGGSVREGIRWLLQRVDELKALDFEDANKAAAGYQVANANYCNKMAGDA